MLRVLPPLIGTSVLAVVFWMEHHVQHWTPTPEAVEMWMGSGSVNYVATKPSRICLQFSALLRDCLAPKWDTS
jgi:hypothetical protein